MFDSSFEGLQTAQSNVLSTAMEVLNYPRAHVNNFNGAKVEILGCIKSPVISTSREKQDRRVSPPTNVHNC